jgi:hypothetical protein
VDKVFPVKRIQIHTKKSNFIQHVDLPEFVIEFKAIKGVWFRQ